MKTKTFLLFLMLVPLSQGFGGYALAESSIQCHCFKERSFNPADTFASDEYILATSFNSLLAGYFKIPKRKIIMVKMNEGVSQDDLLIALKVARVTGVDLRKYLGLRKAEKSWAEIISRVSLEKKVQDDLLLQAIKFGMSGKEAAERISDEIIRDFFSVGAEKIRALRRSGLNEKELALLFIQRPILSLKISRKT